MITTFMAAFAFAYCITDFIVVIGNKMKKRNNIDDYLYRNSGL